MTLRIAGLASALAALTTSVSVAQHRGGVEFGAFGRFTRFDPSLVFDDGFGAGGRIGFSLPSGIGLEGDIAFVSTTAPLAASVTQLPMHARLLYGAPVAPRYAVLLGAGWAHNLYRKPVRQWEEGVSGLLGVRADLSRSVAARLDLVADYYPSPLNESTAITDNWNFSVQAGVGVRLGGSGIRDADHDGVVDPQDACPRTPRGEAVDARGCPLPTDADADGVVDADDRCPGTPAGDRVDTGGCSLPKDADADGVADAADRCPNSPAGQRVNASGCPLDSDGDGVVDTTDRCPDTPAGEPVDANGCPLPKDSDRDGVLDSVDRCSGTPAGQRVNANGCPLLFIGVQRTLVLQGVNFETGSANLTDQSHNTLDRVAAAIIGNPDVRVEVAGYTDNRGGAAANLRLSQARADAVRAYLIGKGVPAFQLTSRGFGAGNPIAPNTTPVGRSRNRRVELHRMR
jgi:outer membrane protein OmpA-like peptidoglycan-associated protein